MPFGYTPIVWSIRGWKLHPLAQRAHGEPVWAMETGRCNPWIQARVRVNEHRVHLSCRATLIRTLIQTTMTQPLLFATATNASKPKYINEILVGKY